jgi:putative endonuclease
MRNNNWLVYLLECSDGTLYCGITNNLDRRIKQHNEGKASRYTRGRRPVKLDVRTSAYMSKGEALRFEALVKRTPKKWKYELIYNFPLGYPKEEL